MQRASMPAPPQLNFPAGTVILSHGASNTGPNQYTILQPNQNHSGGVALLQNQSYPTASLANIPPSTFRVPPPSTYASGAFHADFYQQPFSSQYVATQPVFYSGAFQYAAAPAYATQAAYANGGQAFPIQPSTGYVGPPAMEITSTPTIAVLGQQQSGSSVPMVGMQSNGSNVGLGNMAIASQQQPEVPQATSQPPLRREKKPLQIIDPDTGEDKLVDVMKEKKEHDRVTGIQHHVGGLWKPLVDQQTTVLPQPSVTTLPAGASTSVEQRPSRSGSGTPHLEQPKGQSTRSTSRGQSPTFEGPQKGNESKVHEFYWQFGQQLAGEPRSDQQPQSSRQDDPAVLMPPPSTAPPPRTSDSKPESRLSRTPPPTPPPVPNQIHSSKPSTMTMVEFGVDHSSSAARKKPKDIIGQPEIEFGWLNVSTGDKSLDTTDGGEPIESDLPRQSEKERSNPASDYYCSTPQKQQPPPLNASRDRSPTGEADAGRRSDAAPKSPRDRPYPNPPQSAQALLNGSSSADKFGFTASDISSGMAAPIGARNVSYDQQDSLEEGEIRDMVFEASQPANGNDIRAMTGEQKAAAMVLLEELKKLEAPDGRRCYSHDFMIKASELPTAKLTPRFETTKWSKDNIDEVFNLNRQVSQPKTDTSRRLPPPSGGGFAPSWMPGGMSMDVPPRRIPYPGRVSDTGSMRSDRGGKGSRQGPVRTKQPPLVIARPSIDVELKTSENAWKPGHKVETTDDPESFETKKLFKEVRGILNKITPQTFADLSSEFLALEPRMNTNDRASGVVDIVFQKAVDEPAFCTTYSELYDRMTKYQWAQQQAASNQQLPTKGSVNAANRDTNFRWILLNKCQQEFERDKRTETSRQERETAIANAETADQKKQLQDELDEFLMKEKRRTLGNMRFIGELYLKGMLTNKIMHRCVMELIKSEDEESLECLCKLLTTIGAKLDVDVKLDKDAIFQAQSEGYYSRLKQLSTGTSSRVRFMILDLLELRADSWKPRRKGEGPKTIEQLHRDAAKEKYEQQQELLQEEQRKKEASQENRRGGGGGRREMPNRPSFGAPDHDGRGGKGDRGGGGRDRDQNRQSGRSGAGANNQQQPPQPPADLSKAKAPQLSHHFNSDVRLGPAKWGKQKEQSAAVAAAPRQTDVTPKLSNRFDHLSRSEAGGSAPGSRDSSQTRHEEEQENAGAARKNSGASTMPKYANDDQAVVGATRTSMEPSDSMPSTSAKPSAESSENLEKQLKRYSEELLDELVDSNNYIDALKLIDDKIAYADRILWHSVNFVAEKSEKKRPAAIRALGSLIAHSFASDQRRAGVISGLSSFVRYVVDEDIAQDVPKIWAYIGQILGSALSTSDSVQLIDLNEFATVFRDAGVGGPELLAQTLLAVANLTSKEKSIARWNSVIDRISDFGFEDMAEIESLFRRRDMNYILQGPSAFDACSSSSEFSESVHGKARSTATVSSLPSSISSTTTTVSAGVPGPSDGLAVASMLGSSDLDPILVEIERQHMEGGVIDVDGLIDSLERSGYLKDDDERSLNLLGALVRSLCSKLIIDGEAGVDSVDIDTEEFKRRSKVLLRFVTQRPQLEKKVLNTLGEIYCNRGCPKGLLVKMLSILHESSVIPTETLHEWWNSDGLPGMLRTSGELKAFFSQFATEAGSDAGSDSDQCD